MAASKSTPEDLYSRLSLDEEDEEGFVVANGEIQTCTTYVLIGQFLTERNINFNAMKNVIASLWRPGGNGDS